VASFLNHLNHSHPPDEQAAQQCRTQIEVIETLEHRLSKERNRLQSMMAHLQMKHSPDSTQPSLGAAPSGVASKGKNGIIN